MYFNYARRPNKRLLLRQTFDNFVMELKRRGYSENTIDSYLYFNGSFLEFIRKEQRSITSEDIKEYINHLVENNAEPRTINLAISSLHCYYEDFIRKRLFKFIKRSKIPKNLPRILRKEEIISMIDSTENPKHKLLIELLYSSGLRVGESVKLKVNDIDLESRVIFISNGKGKKDRLVITSERFTEGLKKYLKTRKARSEYVFDNDFNHITIRTAEAIIRNAARRVEIKNRVYPHLLRACFATHLFENNVQETYIQKLMGHEDRKTTQVYIRPRTDDIRKIKSPLDP